LLAAWLLVACDASSPDVDNPGSDGFNPATATGDIVLAFTDAGGVTQTCSDTLPVCGDPLPQCGPNEVLGAPDAASFTLPRGGRLDIGFRCAAIVERGSPNPGELTFDFRIWGAQQPTTNAIIEVSFDGTTYQSLPTRLTASDQSFDLSELSLDVVRFVRIIDTGAGDLVTIDAIEAL